MKKWLVTIGILAVYDVLYVVALVYATSHSKQGNFALMLLELAAIPIVYWVLWRLHEVHHRISEARRAGFTWMIAIALLVSAVVHLFGIFMPEPDVQLVFAFGPVVLIAFLASIRWIDYETELKKQRHI